MSFFIEEILVDEEIKKVMLSDFMYREKAEKIALDIIKTGKKPKLERGMLPLFVLEQLSEYALMKNQARGIDKQITVDTLKDVNIWIDNYKQQFGELGLAEFDWLFYHYTGDLFRLGRLQFRLEKSLDGIPEGEYAIETHIPQGEPLFKEKCLESFEMAKDFFAKYFSEFSPKFFMCDSWLLCPKLADILEPDSNTVKFMKLWQPIDYPKDNSAQAVERVFGFGFNRNEIEHAPETTGLQRRLKKYLLSGGNIDITAGYIKI